MKKKVSDAIAGFLSDNKMNHVFGIVGAGNVHLFDSIFQNPELSLICVHHEQAACMAMQTYYRTSGNVTASILTTGAGSSNGITGVLSAWADSIPCLVISGNENSKYIYKENNLRMYGVQGYDSSQMVDKITKYQTRVMDAKMTLFELEKALFISTHERPGPCWIDIPMNLQAEQIEENDFVHFNPAEYLKQNPSPVISKTELSLAVSEILSELKMAERPVLWLGHGIKLAHAENLILELISVIPAACIISWAGIDMIDSNHPNVFGRAGVYGQRHSNLILQNCDYLLTIGTRLSISQIGYDISELARAAKISVVDVDPSELNKYPSRFNRIICSDARDFIEEIISQATAAGDNLQYPTWIDRCQKYKSDFPRISKEHEDTNGFMNSYAFMARLNEFLKPEQILVTDMGTALLCGHQVLELKPGQRLMTSTGLGEMGYGLPAAMGASFATNSGEVLCLNCDGGMMLNLQELQTIVHHQLPIKIIVFNNDGYLMIKHTQKSMAKGRYAGTNKISGVSCPDFSKIATAFGLPSFQIRHWEDFETAIEAFQNCKTAAICEVFMDPEQLFVPKLSLSIQKDGSLISPPLEDLYPFINRELLRQNMVVGIHGKSEGIGEG